MQKGWHLSKKAIVVYHILFWILFLIYPYMIRQAMPVNIHHFHETAMPFKPQADKGFPDQPDRHFFELMMLAGNIYNIASFYIIAFLLIPRYFNKRHIWKFISFVALLYSGYLLTNYSFHLFFSDPVKLPPIISFAFFFIVLLSIAYSLISERIRLERELQQKENANLKTELQFLRSQISPHFMFNVLNNMVSMARKKSDDLENSLIQLSGLMRYMLYEVKNDKVQLHKELEYLNIYIDLQKQRMKEHVIADFYFEDDPHQYFIEPMLLIPFVENAFKHSQSAVKPEIEIHIILTKAKLSLQVKNTYDAVNCVSSDTTNGIGFTNVKRRLQILYGSKSNLLISKSDSVFQIQLHIEME